MSSSTVAVMTNLSDQFAGLYGLAYNCAIRSGAAPTGTPYALEAAVEQDFQLASIPVFQFAIFYGLDLEIEPGPAMTINGKVHSNQNLYIVPGTSLEFANTVTAVGNIYNNHAPGDPQAGPAVAPIYDLTNQPTPHVNSLSLPLGTNADPAQAHNLLDPPPFGESPNSPTGRLRYYNNTDLIVTVSATGATVTTGNWDDFLASVAPDANTNGGSSGYSFIRTNASFYDAREQKTTLMTGIDVHALTQWMTKAGSQINARVKLSLGHNINSIYVNDQRTAPGALTAVRVLNGQQLPPDGLTVATALPLYVQGHFNAPVTSPGYTNTSTTKPASLAGDAITILSANWSDANSTGAVTQRPASNTTVNAALLGGIVPTTNVAGTGHYSGGVENFTRFLEDWGTGNNTFTYNGSMVVMFASRYATNFWNNPGTGSSNYYNAPNRQWAFDNNFVDYTKLPPAAPRVSQLIRGRWSVVAAQ